VAIVWTGRASSSFLADLKSGALGWLFPADDVPAKTYLTKVRRANQAGP
jgi:hypothetical protein